MEHLNNNSKKYLGQSILITPDTNVTKITIIRVLLKKAYIELN